MHLSFYGNSADTILVRVSHIGGMSALDSRVDHVVGLGDEIKVGITSIFFTAGRQNVLRSA